MFVFNFAEVDVKKYFDLIIDYLIQFNLYKFKIFFLYRYMYFYKM